MREALYVFVLRCTFPCDAFSMAIGRLDSVGSGIRRTTQNVQLST